MTDAAYCCTRYSYSPDEARRVARDRSNGCSIRELAKARGRARQTIKRMIKTAELLKVYDLYLVGYDQRLSLGRYEAESFEQAVAYAKRRYKNMFDRLELPEWNVIDVSATV